MISAGCCPVDMNTNTILAIIPLGGLLVHFPRLSVPTPLELAPSPGPAGSRVILNRQGFLSPSVGQLTTMNPARNLTAPAFWPYSECLQETNPRLPGTSSIVWFADRDGNLSEQLALPIESSGPPLFPRGVTDMVPLSVSIEGKPSSVRFMGLRSICQIHFVVPESAPSPSNVTVDCHDSSVFQQQVETGGA
jgi:hypothetical protein